ncbi:SDR family oxidoreductase (plasmid) [Rhodococcus sp. ZPP]|uniref:SDR family NAD(P)-dependent oxidoreductase n=1 Tax=Rhodococcus sp. ZPP TaxID=2749906 RepID=UPI001AD8762D|nr:SDR family NAD(P)-dependent oxidoreductase [Rhodococcus sp. ZPP]QTJ70532.1 SDR family oxidoreductase [Rhodococcus sp. ZPP]
MSSSDRVALVSGGGGGIGAAVCHTLASAGAHVCVVDIDPSGAERVAKELAAAGLSASAHAGDVSRRDYVDGLAADVTKQFAAPTVLVNLAGAVRNAVLSKITDEDFALVLDTHLKSTLNTLRAFAPGMKERGFGRIVNTSSIASRGTVAGISYSAAKAGIEGLTRSAAIELARHGITVNCVSPGVIATGMFLSTPAEFREEQTSKIPMGRAGTTEEIAACVEFLTSPGAGYITGQTLVACGGLSVGALK